MDNFSFIKLFENDFNSAKLADDSPISKLRYGGFIVQKPNEAFLQITSCATPTTFAGGIKVDLIDCSGTVIKNIDNNFYYLGFVDSDGVNQISFEFGYIDTDYWTKPLHLKITDMINGNIWYSNGFLVTYHNTNLSTRFDYFNKTKIHNISYDLSPYIQSVRLSDCYDQTPANKKELKQYINASGKQTNYRQITTFLRKYILNAVDNFINDRLEVLFSHQQVYVDGQRVVVSDFKVDERKGDTNFMNGEFTINKQGQSLTNSNQLYQYLNLVSFSPSGVYTAQTPIATKTFNNKFSDVFGS